MARETEGTHRLRHSTSAWQMDVCTSDSPLFSAHTVTPPSPPILSAQIAADAASLRPLGRLGYGRIPSKGEVKDYSSHMPSTEDMIAFNRAALLTPAGGVALEGGTVQVLVLVVLVLVLVQGAHRHPWVWASSPLS